MEQSGVEIGNIYKIKRIPRPWMNRTDVEGRNTFDYIFNKGTVDVRAEFHVTKRMYVTGLSENEQKWLESELGYAPGTLNKTNKIFWGDYKVTVGYDSKTLNTSNPRDFLDYKLLSVNSRVANGTTAENLAHADFLMTCEEVEAQSYNKLYEVKQKAFEEFGKMSIKDMQDFTKVYNNGKTKVTHGHTPDQIRSMIGKIVDEKPKEFLEQVRNPNYKSYIFIQDALSSGALSTINRKYYLAGEVDPIGTLEETVEFFNDPKNQGTKLAIKAKIEVPRKKTN